MDEKELKVNRKTKIIKEIESVLINDRRNSLRTRKERHYVLLSIVKDLAALKSLPPSFYLFKQDHLDILCAYWRKQGNTDNTLKNKVAILRHYFRLTHHDIALRWARKEPYVSDADFEVPALSENEFYHPSCRFLISTMQSFGLRLNEALGLQPEYCLPNFLWLPRWLCANRVERHVPVVDDYQQELLENISEQTRLPKPVRSALMRAELTSLGFRSTKNIRWAYVRRRLHSLHNDYSHETCLQIIRHEMGIKTLAPIKKVVL